MTAADARAILSEYARATCAEPGVLRCDVVSEGEDADGTRLWGVWIVFVAREGLVLHERTPHAGKVRLLVSGDGDSGQTLGKLAKEYEAFWCVWPTAQNAWYAVGPRMAKVEDVQEEVAGVGGGDIFERDALAALKERLDVLVESVGLGNAEVLVATARAAEEDYVVELRRLCTRMCMHLSGSFEDSGGLDVNEDGGRLHEGIARAAVLESFSDPRVITIVIAGEVGAVEWNSGVAAELIEFGAWEVRRGTAVFPDLAGWGIRGWADGGGNEPSGDGAQKDLIMRTLGGEEGKAGERKSIEEWFMEQEGIKDKDELEERLAEECRIEDERREQSGDNALADPYPEPGKVVEAKFDRAISDKSREKVLPLPAAEVIGRDAAEPSALDAPALELHSKHGSGAFARIEALMRGLCGKDEDEVLRVSLVSGWNEARCQPLVMELDKGMDADRVKLEVALSVYGASASLASVAAGVSAARKHGADVIIGFGGGAVMDTAKAIASLLPLSPRQASEALGSIRGIAGAGHSIASVLFDSKFPSAVPVILVAGTVGSGAEVSEASILKAPLRRVSVCFGNAGKRMAIADPRLILPRRSSSRDVAMGGFQGICFAIDVLLCPSAPKQALELAERAIAVGRDAVLRARREPVSSDGPSRDELVNCATFAALAREVSGLGVITCLSLALLDGAEPTTTGLDAPLRTILPRVTAATLAELDLVGGSDVACRVASLVLQNEDASGAELSHYILSLAEDIGVPLVDAVGVHAVDMEDAVQTVMSGGLVSPSADSRLLSRDALSHIVLKMTEQMLEL